MGYTTTNEQFSGKYSLCYILIFMLISISIEIQVISLTMMKPFSGQNNASLYKGLIFGSSIGGALLISFAIIGGCVHFKYNRVRTKYNRCCKCIHFIYYVSMNIWVWVFKLQLLINDDVMRVLKKISSIKEISYIWCDRVYHVSLKILMNGL